MFRMRFCLFGYSLAALFACCLSQAANGWQPASTTTTMNHHRLVPLGHPVRPTTTTTTATAPAMLLRGGAGVMRQLRLSKHDDHNDVDNNNNSSSSSNSSVAVVKSPPSTTLSASQSAANNNDTRLDKILFGVYLCTCVGSSLPTILMPLIAAELAATATTTTFSSAAFIAATASTAALGGGFGKLINGFLCQAAGGKLLSAIYLLGITACTTLLSTLPVTPVTTGLTLAGLEFFVSAQWPACSLVLSNHFGHNAARFAQAITVLSLSSTMGTLLGKLGGTALLPIVPSWRIAARAGAIMTLVGAILMQFFVTEFPDQQQLQQKKKKRVAAATTTTTTSATHQRLSLQQIRASLQAVTGSRLFWLAGLAHATTYLARSSDRVLPALFQDLTALPKSLCGLLTAAVTLGFVHGLGKAKTFHALPDIATKTDMLKQNYFKSVLYTLGLGLVAIKPLTGGFLQVAELASHKVVVASILALLSGGMASSLAFQFYQIPPLVASTFGENKAVCLSFLDAMGFFMSFFMWRATGMIVGSLGDAGWPATFLLLSSLFGFGGWLMSRQYPSIERGVLATAAAS